MYIDGFVIPVYSDRIAEYRKWGRKFGKKLIQLGALQYIEAQGDYVPSGKVTSFDLAVKKEPGETVFFSYVVYPNKRTRDKVNKIIMSDPEVLSVDMTTAPFNGARMIYGGFKGLIELSAE